MILSKQCGEGSFFQWGFMIFDKWIQIKNKKKSLATYFDDNSMKYIAIYGLGGIGKRLYEELSEENLQISCGIDRNATNIWIDGLTMKSLEDILPKIDVVVVTPISFYEIRKEIHEKMGEDIDVVFIEDVINYCFDKFVLNF